MIKLVTVTSGKSTPSDYHHGNLRAALLDAVEAQLPDKGPEGVSLRAAAKAVGVSPAAAFRHFRDKRAVMTAIAVRAHEGMADAMAQAVAEAAETGVPPFVAVGRAYLDFALSEPTRFQTMFRNTLLDRTDPDLQRAEVRLIAPLLTRAGKLPGDHRSGADPADIMASVDIPPEALLAWGAVHGLAMLAVEDAFPGQTRDGLRKKLQDALILLGN